MLAIALDKSNPLIETSLSQQRFGRYERNVTRLFIVGPGEIGMQKSEPNHMVLVAFHPNHDAF